MNRGGEPPCTEGRAFAQHERRHSPHRRSRSPWKDKCQRGSSPRSRGEASGPPCPLSFSVFIGNKPMTEADSIIRDLNMAVEFVGQIFPPEVQQSMLADKPVPNATLQVTSVVGWHREGLVYKKNEVISFFSPISFLDIVESANLLMSSKGSVLRCDVTGKILMKCFLSGMLDLKLGLNDKIGLEKELQIESCPTKSGKTIELDDVTFHQCVNLTRFNSKKTISFVPPDSEFEFMK
ncbi:AP-2 complex subunit mu-like [Camellia sinensis]|uniref:AP-2 complex subunit mu-like n=1 Tax=Camellia sinensis TaxID=4442 RepID=UPI001035D470|nr:AP-2 complex subunit mu-like [Camellia sinensis]